MQNLLTLNQVAEILGKSPKTVRRYMAERGLRYLQPFPYGPIWFRYNEIKRWTRGNSQARIKRKATILREIK